jgi:dTDP-4-dehydrorhamnose 3,5-epimerase
MAMSFTTQPLSLPGVMLISPKLYPDNRGVVAEVFRADQFLELGATAGFVQDNLSISKKGVIRGMHFQKLPHAQAKLVRCVNGHVYDAVADIDPASATYGQFVSVELSAEKQEMLYIPDTYAHGFCVLSDEATVEYKVSDLYHPESASGIAYNDPMLAIPWPVQNPILSEADTRWPTLAEYAKGKAA